MGQSATGKKDVIDTVENEYCEKLPNIGDVVFKQFFTINSSAIN